MYLITMVRQKDVCDSDGVLERMQKGVIVRHLILPGQVEESKKVIRYLYETYGDQIYTQHHESIHPQCLA
mgnify:CR=1 FL=1